VLEREGVVSRGEAEVLRLQRADPMKGLTGVVLGACCAIVIACSASMKQSATPAPQMADHGQTAMPGSPQDQEIDRLAKEIETQRVELGLPQPSGAQAAHAMAASAITPTLTCKPTTDTCTQSCTLADSICSNAKKICDIAAQLDGDQWAATKCSDGNQTCQNAKTRCCECTK
jgi:hypothetical protein